MQTMSSRLIWFIGLLISSIGAAISVSRELKALKESDSIYWSISFVIVLILLGIVILTCIIIVIWYKPISKMYEEWRYKKQKINSDFLLNHVRVYIEYVTDDGDIVSVSRREHITNIKSTKTLSTTLETEGIIESPYGINSSFTTLSKNRIKVYSLLNLTEIQKSGGYYSSYTLTVKGGFLKKEEYWIFGVSNFCNFYEIHVIIPVHKKLLNAKLLFKEVPTTNEKEVNNIDLFEKDWLDDDSTSVMITKGYYNTRISVNLSSLRENYRYKLTWELQ